MIMNQCTAIVNYFFLHFLRPAEENVIFVEDLNWGRWWDAKSRGGKSSSSEPKLGFQHTKRLNLEKLLKKS